MAERMVQLSHRFPNAQGIRRRALDQAAREVMLAQSSDWAFIMKTGTTVPYATKRTNDHVKRFTRIYDALMSDAPIDEAWLAEVQRRDNLFPEADYRVYAS
jgi:1,4-alpha-glucan branching enzyme